MRYHNTSHTQDAQAFDLPVKLTRFPDRRGMTKKEVAISMADLAEWIKDQRAETKGGLPWIKLATFGKLRSAKNSFRHNANVQTVTGLEGDYDAGTMSPEAAREALQNAGVAGLVYTTASHSADKPRWRVFAPFSGPLPPDAREDLMARLNGVLGGQLAGESFTLSQAYYAGTVEGSSPVQTWLVDGQPIDRVARLSPIYKDGGRAKAERVTSSGEKSGLPFREIRDGLLAIPNDGSNPEADSRDWWLKRLAALHHETDGGEDGLELAHAWSEQHPSYDPNETDAAWRSFRRGDGATAATILADARAHGWRGETELARMDAAFDEMWTEADLDAQTQADIERLVGPPRRDKPRLTFLSPADCEDLPARRYVIKGLLAEGDVATIVGAPGAGKSLLAPYLGFAVARGERAFGRRTRQGGVFYVAAEDGLGMRARIRALREEHGEADGFRLVAGVSDLLTKSAEDLKELVMAIKRDRPSLVIVDTVALAFPGVEENDAKSMGRVVAVARALTRWGAAVVLIHHDTKDGANGLPRGHSILNGALDANLYLKRDDGIVSGRLTKNRNGSTDEKLAFTVATIPLGEDEDGDPITTALCREASNADLPEKEVKLSPSAKAALTVFFDVGDGAPVSEDDWREAANSGRKVSSAEDRDSRRRTFKRAVEELTRKNVLVFRDGQFAQGDSPEGWFTDDDA